MNTPRMLLATVGMWSAFFTSSAAKADELKQSGVITSVAASATLSTKGMSPGAQIVASWQTLPPRGKVEIPKADKGMWAHLHLGLSGSGVLLGDISPECRFFRIGPAQDTSSLEINANPGDGFACNYSVSELWGGVHRVENRGTEPYVSAKLDIGGPWSEGMVNVGLEFDKAGALNKPMGIDPAVYSVVEGEILRAGAMTVTIRQVTMPPGL